MPFNFGVIEIKNVKIRIALLFTVVIIICLIAGTFYSSALYRISYSNINDVNSLNFVSANNQLMISGINKNKLIYNNVSDNNRQYTFTVEKNIEAYAISVKGICTTNLEHKENNLYFYDFFFQSFDGTYKNHINLGLKFKINKYNFALDNDFNIYITSYPNKGSILKFSKKGKLLSEISAQNNIEQLMFINNRIYSVCGGLMYYINNNSLTSISTSDKLVMPCTYSGNNCLYDCQGKLFELKNNSLKLIADFNSENTHCVKTKNYYLYSYQNSIYGNNIKKPDTSVYYNFDIFISCIYYYNSYIYVGGYNGNKFYVYKITDNELIFNEPPQNSDNSHQSPNSNPQKPNSNPKNPNSNPQNQNSNSQNSNSNTSDNNGNNSNNITPNNNSNYHTLKYSSKVYKFKNGNIIYNIKNNTYVTVFKKNINCNGTVTLYDKNGSVKTSGKVGTGMTVIFSKGNEKAQFKIAVNGDLTGEGNVNSLDLNKMFNYLLNQISLTDVEIVAGDINQDNKISNKDLVLLDRLTD